MSDPGARAGNGPASVRRGRSRHGCRCRVSVVRASVVGPGAAAKQVHMCARNGTRIFRTIRSRSCGKSWSRTALVRCPLRSAKRVNNHGHVGGAGHHAIDVRSVLGTVQGSSLRSARACARPAGLDDACAQIGLGHYVMAGGVMTLSWTDLAVDRELEVAVIFPHRPCLLHTLRERIIRRGALKVTALRATTDSPLPDFSTVLNRDRSQSHFEIRDSQPHTASPSGHAAAVHHRGVAVSPGHSREQRGQRDPPLRNA